MAFALMCRGWSQKKESEKCGAHFGKIILFAQYQSTIKFEQHANPRPHVLMTATCDKLVIRATSEENSLNLELSSLGETIWDRFEPRQGSDASRST